MIASMNLFNPKTITRPLNPPNAIRLEWVMERQVVKTEKASGIVNDANDFANETVGTRAIPSICSAV